MSEVPERIHLMTRVERPVIIDRGEGIYLIDENGKRYIDGSGGPIVVGVGYGNKEIIDAMYEQAKKLCFGHGLRSISTISLKWAETIANFAPGNLKYVAPVAGGGGDAVEGAIKIALGYWLIKNKPAKSKPVSRWMSWHGGSMGAMSVSGHHPRRKYFTPLIRDWPKIPPAYCYRCWCGREYPNCDMDCAWELERTIRMEHPENISMFLAEPIVGSSLGSYPAPKEYFKIIREICDKYETLFVSDEVMTGFCRTGRNFGIEHYGVLPDVMVCAKGITSGYMPMGAIICSEEVNRAFERHPVPVGSTFAGHYLACAASLATVNYIVKNKLVENVANLEKRFFDKLNKLYDHPSVGDVRGKGFFAGMEFVKDKETKETLPPEMNFSQRLIDQCWENGLYVYSGTSVIPGLLGDHIQIAPHLICTAKDIDTIVEIIDNSLTQVEDKLGLR